MAVAFHRRASSFPLFFLCCFSSSLFTRLPLFPSAPTFESHPETPGLNPALVHTRLPVSFPSLSFPFLSLCPSHFFSFLVISFSLSSLFPPSLSSLAVCCFSVAVCVFLSLLSLSLISHLTFPSGFFSSYVCLSFFSLYLSLSFML